MPTLVCRLLSHWKSIDIPVKVLRCDNAGENRKLEDATRAKKYQLGITFEYAIRATPEQNSRVEKSIDTAYNRTKACIVFAHLPDKIKPLVVRECITQVTNVSNLRIMTLNDVTATALQHFFGSVPKYGPYLHVIGEAAVVHLKHVATKKMDNVRRKLTPTCWKCLPHVRCRHIQSNHLSGCKIHQQNVLPQ